jgi:hypothetical protein
VAVAVAVATPDRELNRHDHLNNIHRVKTNLLTARTTRPKLRAIEKPSRPGVDQATTIQIFRSKPSKNRPSKNGPSKNGPSQNQSWQINTLKSTLRID